MGKVDITADKKQAGFTLVELAVVMIIIGLLIGGVLKGQELISNAQIASTVAGIKGIDAATSTFSDTYNAFPGDMVNAQARIPNCAGTCANGNGNSFISNAGVAIAPNSTGVNAGEALNFWIHLNLADLISGVDNTGTAAFGASMPTTNVGGGLVAGYVASGAIGGRTATATGRGGHYLVLRNDAATAGAGSTLTANQAARIDRKMDDGSPNAGTVMAIGTAGVAGCASAATAVGVYNENLQGLLCDVAIRIQQ